MQRIANCPSCGAPVQFLWSGAAQTVCPFCKSILIRTDIDWRMVGKVADLPPDPSPIQILAEGVYQRKNFQVVGRIIYEYEQGGWNEWHIVLSDGSSGWLSDAQLQYAVSFLANPGTSLPAADWIRRGAHLNLMGDYEVSTVTRARYRGVEGELPFHFWGKDQMTFADLRTTGRKFGTLDYSEPSPLLYLGEWVELEDLQLKNLRQFEGWA